MSDETARNPFLPPVIQMPIEGCAAMAAELDAFTVPEDAEERRRLMEVYRDDPSPVAGYKFWRLAFPDIEAGFWAARHRAQAEGGSNP